MSRCGDTEPISTPGRAAVTEPGRFTPPWARPGSSVPRPSAAPFVAPATVPACRRSRVRELGKWVVALLIFALLAPPLLGGSLLAAVFWQARTDETRSVEAIVVLGAAQYNGRPSPVFRARLDRALAVYRAGYAPLLVVAGGKAEGDAFTEAEAGRGYLIGRGVAETAILLENEGSNSWRSMQGVARLLENRGLSIVLLVSDGFHLLRVKLMARELGLTAYATAADESPIRPWGGTEFGYAVREVAGIAAFWWESR